MQAALFCEDYPTLKDRHVGRIELELPSWMGRLKEDKAYGLCVKLDPALGGGVLMLRNLDDPGKYMSTEFGLVAIDELTKDKKDVFDNLRARLRWPGIPRPQFIAGTNPGNIGHEWVKSLWVDRFYPPEEQEPEEFGYVPARVDDNPHVDPSYVKSLESLPDRLRKALREGSWDIAEGQFFTDFDRSVHVVDDRDINEFPDNWAKIRAIDVSGRNGYTACIWAVVDNNADVWIYREYFATGLDSDQHAKNIWDMSHKIDSQGNVIGENYRYSVMDTAAWAKMGLAETTAEIYLRIWGEQDMDKGTSSQDSLVPANKERVMGWDVVNQYLRHNPEAGKFTQLKIMEKCRNMIRCLPLLMVSEKNPNDVKDMPGVDDLGDALRYLLVTLRDSRSPDGLKVQVSETSAQRRLREINEEKQRQKDAAMYQYFKS